MFNLGLLAFQAMWLLLVLPGHTRGAISWTRGASASDACCFVQKGTTPAPNNTPTKEQQKNCAVCYYALGLTPPPVLDLYVPDLGLIKIIPLLPVPMHAEQDHLLTYHACGPPTLMPRPTLS
jgi:hypothetical protein